jgi:hypothetical protein
MMAELSLARRCLSCIQEYLGAGMDVVQSVGDLGAFYSGGEAVEEETRRWPALMGGGGWSSSG